jgi:predicted branched-subunit amino acid permease
MTQGPIVFTRQGMLRGARAALPMLLGTIPFSLVTGIAAQSAGLSALEQILMSATVFGGAAQLLVLGNWATPAPVLTATLAAFTVNLRLILMGPVLGPWFDRLRGWPLWGSLFLLVDQNWGLALKEMNAGGRDAGWIFGSGLAMWLQWVVMSAVGHAAGATLQLPPGHPLFFCSLAVFVCMLAGQWRGKIDILPWVVAGSVAVTTSLIWPGSFTYIVAGAVAGSLTGAIRDTLRA